MENAKLFIKYLVSIIGMFESGAVLFIAVQDIFFGYGVNVPVMVACLIAFVLFNRMYDSCAWEE